MVVPLHQGPGIRIPCQLAQIIMVTGRLPVVVVLVVEALAGDRHFPGVRVCRQTAAFGRERLEHTIGLYHHGIFTEAVNAVQPHCQITGNVEPQWHLMFDSGSRIGSGSFAQYLPGGAPSRLYGSILWSVGISAVDR